MQPLVAYHPGRACLLGEHCDWAGGASLAVPLPVGVRVEARSAPPGTGVSLHSVLDGDPLHGRWPVTGGVDPEGGPLRFVPAALQLLCGLGLEVPDTALQVESDLPPGRGFSSSAAFTLSVLDALARRADHHLEPRRLAQLAFEVEHDLLGVECGLLDQLACAEGVPVFIQWQGGQPQVRAIRPYSTFHLVAIAFPAPRDTKGILATLNRHFFDQPGTAEPAKSSAVRQALAAFAEAAALGAAALERGDETALGRVMNVAQRVYERELDTQLPELRAPVLRATCAQLLEAGALGAKFSGAGGEGSVVALYPDRGRALASVERLGAARVGTALYCPIG